MDCLFGYDETLSGKKIHNAEAAQKRDGGFEKRNRSTISAARCLSEMTRDVTYVHVCVQRLSICVTPNLNRNSISDSSRMEFTFC